MKQRLGIVIALFCLSPAIFAQQKAEKNAREDNASFTFTESQLNEDDDAAQSASAFVSSNNDVYLSNVGYLFSPMRFRVRGYNSQYSDTYINGVLFNDVETGRFSYGMIGGLNDATRNKEGIGAFEINNFTFGPIGGATNINMRASQYAAGSKLSLSGCNRNYILRGMYTYSTGLLKNGWAFTGSLGYRWANEGVIEGTFYNAFSYFLAAEKVFNDKHSLSIATWGAPTERGQQGASTEEAYYLANSHYYNPNWGYQNGEKRNSRVVRSFEPSAIASWDFDINKEIPEKQWIRALNNFLPDDIYIKDSFIVDESFHARYSAKKKEYRYLVSTKPYNPIERLYVYQHNRSLDIEAMRECAKIFLGEHDFASFCVFNGLGDTIRVIETIDIQEKDGIVTMRFIGNGFRRYMVRLITGALIQVGSHWRTKEFVEDLLNSKGKKKCLFKAKPEGLYLQEVYYEEND